MSQKPSSMGIARVEPCQLVPTLGTTGSGSTDLLAPSPTITDLSTPTRVDGSSSAMAVDSAPPIDIDIDLLTNNFDINTSIDVDTALTTIVGIAMPTVIDATLPATMVNITGSIITDTTSPSIANFVSAPAIDSPAVAIVELISSLTGQLRQEPEVLIWLSACSTSA
jgi:hypothetical protein